MAKPNHPTIRELRLSIPEKTLSRSILKGMLLFLTSGSIYVATFIACLSYQHSLLAQIAFAVINTISIPLLFIIGHDACHGSLTDSNWLNKVLGRLAFLPPWHPFTSWEHGHNRLHHCFTNLRGKDYVWTPYSKSEFDKLPTSRRMLERFYRTVWGVGAYYLIEIWLWHMILPRRTDLEKMPRVKNAFDRLGVLLFIGLQIGACVAFSDGSANAILRNVLLIVLIPQLGWNWMMGFVILLHHTHPSVHWYKNDEEWTFYAGQVQSTVHVEFGWPFGPLLHNIMEHTAHHIDPRIPLYNLPTAQRAVVDSYSHDVIVSPFTVTNFLSILSTCQLYDYEKHCWQKFNGTPTTEPLQFDAHAASNPEVSGAHCDVK